MTEEMKKSKKIEPSIVILIIAVCILTFIAWQQGGTALMLDSFLSGGKSLLSVFPLLIAAFITAGLIQVTIKKEIIERWLGSESGIRGLLLACLGGALIPGGPYAYYPIAGALMKTGAGIGVLIAFITAKNLWAFSRLPLEIALLGTELTFIRILLTFMFPILFGFLAEILFGRYINKIREGVQE